MTEEGDDCKDLACGGSYEFIRSGDCSCHISPPCFNCTDAELICGSCGEPAA